MYLSVASLLLLSDFLFHDQCYVQSMVLGLERICWFVFLSSESLILGGETSILGITGMLVGSLPVCYLTLGYNDFYLLFFCIML